MPYIDINRRYNFADDINPAAQTPGELNYKITELIIEYINTHGESYQTYNDCLGALEGCKLELYRRKIADYEDLKKDLNGDVF